MLENNSTPQVWFLDKVKSFVQDFVAWFMQKGKNGSKLEISFGINKQTYLVTLGIFGVMSVVTVMALFFIWSKNSELTARTWDLKELNKYDLTSFQQSEVMAEDKDSLPQTIEDIVGLYSSSKEEKERIEGELTFKKSVYTEFLRNLLLPSLNIWKDPYTKDIDISILGKKYLDTNPYQDISLLSQWSSIIRESGKDVGDNEVVNMKIGEINELENGFFNIPISISFKSDSKRAFLLLVDKLSLTSNINNLGLLNDFSYYLFNVIREKKAEEINQLVSEYQLTKPQDQNEKSFYNAVISRYLYNRLQTPDSESNILIDEEVVDETIKQSIVCGMTESSDICYFRFRDKYRTIPGLAYGIGLESLVNKPLSLKRFFASIPPLIAIESFTFDKAKAQGVSLANNNEYLGNVNFNIYGRGISAEDTEQISRLLTESCFGEKSSQALDASWALAVLQKSLDQMSQVWQADVERMANLLELKDTLLQEGASYDSLSPYNKMIKKFEFYRMLKNIGLCRG